MKSDDSVTGPINLGNPHEFRVRELAEQLLAKLGSDAGIIEQPLPSDDPRQRQPDIAKARELLGWEPKVALSEGLDRTIAYFEEQLNGGSSGAGVRPLGRS
jgi:UDP-glucuronate decarboxylase